MKDAAGNIPSEKNRFERSWAEAVENGTVQKRFDRLHMLSRMPLKAKIEKTLELIRDWTETWNGKTAVSFSGGADSTVMLHLVRRLYPKTEAVFCNTGLEYPELVKFVKQFDRVKTLRPAMHFREVLNRYGYPMISKKTARGISILSNPTGNNQNVYRLYDRGINRFGSPVHGFKVAERWKFLVHAPFRLSDHCCYVMKKEPMQRYSKSCGNTQFVGTLAADSKERQKAWIRNGCNAYDLKYPHSAPLSFWTKQDIMQFLKMHSIPYAPVYGDIRQDKSTGKLYFTGLRSTGCIFCGFGLHMEKSPNRFQQLHDTHPKLWKYCMNTLGLGDILAYIRRHCPDRNIRTRFRGEPDPPALKQRGLWE